MKIIIIKKYFPIIATLFLAACSSPAIDVKFNTTNFINPDHHNHALPILIRIYQLAQADSFKEATFHQLWLYDNNVLGAAIINRQEIVINPDSTITVKINPDKRANYMGIIALYRTPKHSQWRLIQSMPGTVSAVFSQISIKISGNTMTFTSSQRDKQQ